VTTSTTAPGRGRPTRVLPLRRHPVTLAALAALPVTALLSGGPVGGPSPEAVGAGLGRPVRAVLTSAFWCPGAWSYAAAAAATVLLLGSAERRLGSRTALAALVAGHVLGTAAALAGIAALAATGDAWALELRAMVVVGPYAGLLAVAGLATARTPALWRRRVRLGLSIALVALVLYSGTTGDVVRLTSWCAGLAAGSLLRRPDEAAAPPHPSRRERRALVALVVAVTALGPLVAALSRTPDGPWAVVSHLFVSSPPDHDLLRALCGPGGEPAECHLLQARARLTGHGPALLSVLPVLLQVVLAEGLRRGRRAAWVAAVAFGAVLTAVGGYVVLTVLRAPAEELPLLDARPGSLPAAAVFAPLLSPLAVLLLLVATRGLFGVRAAPGAARRWLLAATSGTVLVGAGYVVAGSLLRREFAGTPSPVDLLLDLPERMLPPGYLGEVLAPLVPLHGGARVLADWTGVAVWSVLLLTAARLIRPTAPAGDAVRARALVDRYGEGPLSFMTTWVGNRYWFLPDGSAVVAYRVIGGVAITTGDPVGPPAARAAAVRGFTAWCEDHGWTPCWYSVTGETASALAGRGVQQLQVAAETWLPLGTLAFTGRRWQDVRTALNRARREGLEARWISWAQAPPALRDQLAGLSEQWLAAKGLPEMGFTLGGLDELADDAVRCLVAVDREGRPSALTSWLPAHRDGVPVGWTLDVMRRSAAASPGVVEFLIATAALTFQDEGAEWVSLSGAPLALSAASPDRGLLPRLLELAGRTMEPVYGFRSLLAFKAKFQPRYRPLWLVYPGPADLPRIARAVSAAYLPHLSAGQAVRLARALVHGNRGATGRRGGTAGTRPGRGAGTPTAVGAGTR
jgi:phosphatidylglycerol lysyltransferase